MVLVDNTTKETTGVDIQQPNYNQCVTLQVGNCGNRIGNYFWKMICEEHGIDRLGNFTGDSDDQLLYITSFFYESITGRYIPRCVLADLEYNTLDEIQNMDICSLHSPDSFSFGDDVGTSCNYAKGFYTHGTLLVDDVLGKVRRQAEECDEMNMVQIMHSVSGGTGSGFTSLITTYLLDHFAKSFMVNYTVSASAVGSTINQMYNTSLAFNSLMYDSSAVVSFNNASVCDTLESMSFLPGKQTAEKTWDNMNHLIGRAICGITAPGRLPGQLPSSLETTFTNINPFPGLHFFDPTVGPCCAPKNMPYRTFDLVDVMADVFNPNFSLGLARTSLKMSDLGNASDNVMQIICGAMLYRGNVPVCRIESTLYEYQLLHTDLFVSWLPNALFTNVVRISPQRMSMCGTAIFNLLDTQDVINKIAEDFKINFQLGANLNYYVDEGMCIEEFEDTYNSMKNFTKAYDQVKN